MAGILFDKASGVNNSIYGKSQEPIKAIIEAQVESFENDSMLNKIYVQDSTDKYAGKYTYETSFGNFEAVGEAGAYPRTGMQEGYAQVIEPDTWKNSFEVSQEMIEDANMGKVKSLSSQFTLSYNRTKEYLGAALLAGAYNASVTFGNGANQRAYNTTSADQVALFSTSHPSKTSASYTQSNFYANPFSYDALCQVEEAMQNFTDDDGNILNVMPDTIVIPNKGRTKKLVFDAIGAEGIPGTANNSMNMQFGRWNVIIWPYLNRYIPSAVTAGTDPWFLLDSKFNEAFYGAIWLDRIPLSVKSYIDDNTDNNVFKGRARFKPGFNNWRFIALSAPGLGGTVLS